VRFFALAATAVLGAVCLGAQQSPMQVVALALCWWAIAIAESDEEHSWHWEKMGWIRLDVNYREPKFGMHWSDFGQPSFIPLAAFVHFLKPGSEEARRSAAVQSLKAFLLDNYALNDDEPTVLETCALAQSITL
jgi:hypothetical protein